MFLLVKKNHIKRRSMNTLSKEAKPKKRREIQDRDRELLRRKIKNIKNQEVKKESTGIKIEQH
jgi:hypothetical protein